MPAKLDLAVLQYWPGYVVDRGPVVERDINRISLDSMPVLKSFPTEAGRFITFGMTVTK
jgi:UbiD family decarboxylase